MTEVQIDAPAVSTAATSTSTFTEPNFNGDTFLDTTPKTEGALFNANAWDVSPKIDGQASDAIEISFTGKLVYDATSEEGQQLFERFQLGSSVNLKVEGVVARKAGSYKQKTDAEVVTGSVGIKIENLYVQTPEDL